ncbi:MAG: hypothetical protein M3O61_04735 [Gemmatimonadota bacterium]|nr:hypothetical protein [Gemmatimonadota bacterium]
MRGRSPARQIGATVAHVRNARIRVGGVLSGGRDPSWVESPSRPLRLATGVTGGGARPILRAVESLGGMGSAAWPLRSNGRDARGARGRLHQE